MLIVGGSESGKTNALFNNVISHQPDIDKIYFYVKDPVKAKHQLLINKVEGAAIKHFNDSEVFITARVIWMIFIRILKNTIQI